MYYTQQMQPQMGMYQNFNQPMPMQNPYMDRMAQLQQYQQNLSGTQMSLPNQTAQSQGVTIRVVNNFNEITANDVPMDVSAAFFPKADGTEIQARAWRADGTIQTVVYKPVLEQNQQDGTNTQQMDFSALNDWISAFREEILARLDNIEKSVAKPAASRAKKTEVVADE